MASQKAVNFLLVAHKYTLENWKSWDSCDVQNYLSPGQVRIPFSYCHVLPPLSSMLEEGVREIEFCPIS